MIRFFTIIMLLLVLSTSAQARINANPSDSCKNLDMENTQAVLQCLKDDQKYDRKIRPRLDAGVKCHQAQDIVVKRYIVSTDPSLESQLRKTGKDALPRPSCAVVAEIVNEVASVSPVWSSCIGYAEANNKFEHFKNCVIGFVQAYNRYDTPQTAKITVSSFACDRALKTYNSAHQRMNRAHFPEQGKPGVYTPVGYEPPPCHQVNAWLEELKDVKTAHNKKVAEENKALRQQQIAAREEKKALKAAKIKEQQDKAKRTQKAFAAMDKSYDFSEQTKRALKTVNIMEHPTDVIEAQHIRRALIQRIQKLVPEEDVSLMGINGETRHTTGGFKSYFTNVPSAPKIYYGVDSVDIKQCDIKNNQASCRYVAQFFTNVDNSGVTGQQRAGLDTLYKLSGAGPRIAEFQNNFQHDGTQWKAVLNSRQDKLLLPPPPPKRNPNDDDAMCDVLTLMGAGVC